MKRAPEHITAIENARESTKFTNGRLPERQNTVIAELLANLLDGHHVTGMEAVFGMSSTRLSHHIWALGTDHGWYVDRRDKVVGTKDGRVQTISEYWLPLDAIESAMNHGAREWIAEVRRQRMALRRKAAEALREAERIELSKRQSGFANPAQFGLFYGNAA